MKIITDIEYKEITPEQLAEAFWDMDDDKQARFFGHLGACALASSKRGEFGSYLDLDMQLWNAARKCTGNGLRVMECFSQIHTEERLARLQPYTLVHTA